jgi:hypothetical protein
MRSLLSDYGLYLCEGIVVDTEYVKTQRSHFWNV